jgi:hypothetical protein
MRAIIFLKEIKFYFIHRIEVIFFILFIKNLFNLVIFKNFFRKTPIKSLGKFEVKLNPLKYEELRVLNDKYFDIDYIQSFRYFIKENTTFFLYKVESNILKLFISNTLGCKVFCFEKKENVPKKNNNLFFLNEKDFIDKLNTSNLSNTILISDDYLNNNLILLLKKIGLVFLKKELQKIVCSHFYHYIYDFYGKINTSSSKYCKFNYHIYSKSKLLSESNKKIISGVTLLKNLDIYPFDLCYENVLPLVDEFLIAIDESSFNKKYEIILNNFLNETKFRNKIKIKYFNFNSNTSSNCHVPARWVADVNNKITNYASGKFIFYVQADELFDSAISKKIHNLISRNYEEYIFNFYHFLFNFNYIRDPRYAAYNKTGRIFEKDKFVSTHDGVGFRKINNLRSNYFNTNLSVFHLGYVCNYKKKINLHLSNNFFRTSKYDYYKHLKPIKVAHEVKSELINTVKNLKYLSGYNNIIKFCKNNNE